ncbi:MAG: hypothetical protein AAB074_03370 [Planctomycetota bacterium]
MSDPDRRWAEWRARMADDGRAWTLWYSDTFDRESAPSEEVRGTGTLRARVELWRRTLGEAVQENGNPSFSRFWVWLEAPREPLSMHFEDGRPLGAAVLRSWCSDPERLDLLALADVAMQDSDGGLCGLAEAAQGDTDLERRLREIAMRREPAR